MVLAPYLQLWAAFCRKIKTTAERCGERRLGILYESGSYHRSRGREEMACALLHLLHVTWVDPIPFLDTHIRRQYVFFFLMLSYYNFHQLTSSIFSYNLLSTQEKVHACTDRSNLAIQLLSYVVKNIFMGTFLDLLLGPRMINLKKVVPVRWIWRGFTRFDYCNVVAS